VLATFASPSSTAQSLPPRDWPFFAHSTRQHLTAPDVLDQFPIPWARLQEFVLVCPQPVVGEDIEPLRLRDALGQSRLGNEVTGVFSEIALPAQTVEPNEGLRVDSECRRKRLYCCLMMPGFAC
jgi:hypothetical protein